MVLYRIDNRKIFLKFSLWKSAYKIDNNTRSEAAVVRGWKKLTFFFFGWDMIDYLQLKHLTGSDSSQRCNRNLQI